MPIMTCSFDRESYVMFCSPCDSNLDILCRSHFDSIFTDISLMADRFFKAATFAFTYVALPLRLHHCAWNSVTEIVICEVFYSYTALICP